MLEVAVAPIKIGGQSFGSASVSPIDGSRRLHASILRNPALSEAPVNQMSNERVERQECASPAPLPSRRSGLEETRKSSDNT